MKKLLLVLCCAASVLLASCAAAPDNEPIDLTVFAASSLADSLEQIALRYRDAAPQIRLHFQFGASGDLAAQIRDGADCDFFLSASPVYVDALDSSGVLPDSRVEFLENQLVLVVPPGNPKEIRNFAHLSALLRQNELLLSVGGGGAALGDYTRNLFDYYYLDEASLSRSLSYALSVKETATRVRADMADAGIIYRTDADGLTILDTADSSMSGRVVYTAAIPAGSRRPEAAAGFCEYLTGTEAGDVFTRAGFVRLSDAYSEPEEEYNWEGAYWEDEDWNGF